MTWELVTNHMCGLQVLSVLQGMGRSGKITGSDVGAGWVHFTIEVERPSDIFWIGRQSQSVKVTDEFNTFGNLPIDEAKERLKVPPQ